MYALREMSVSIRKDANDPDSLWGIHTGWTPGFVRVTDDSGGRGEFFASRNDATLYRMFRSNSLSLISKHPIARTHLILFNIQGIEIADNNDGIWNQNDRTYYFRIYEYIPEIIIADLAIDSLTVYKPIIGGLSVETNDPGFYLVTS